jgi:hypothetical protein
MRTKKALLCFFAVLVFANSSWARQVCSFTKAKGGRTLRNGPVYLEWNASAAVRDEALLFQFKAVAENEVTITVIDATSTLKLAEVHANGDDDDANFEFTYCQPNTDLCYRVSCG